MSPTQQTRLALEMAFTKSAGMDKEAINFMPAVKAVGGLAEKAMPTFSRWGRNLAGWAGKKLGLGGAAAKGITGANVYDPLKVTADNIYQHASLPIAAGAKAAPAAAKAVPAAAKGAAPAAAGDSKGIFDNLVGKARANPLTTAGVAAGTTGVAGLGYGELRNGQGQEEGAAKAIDGFQGQGLLPRIMAALAPGSLNDAAGAGVAKRLAQKQIGRPPNPFGDYIFGR